MKLFVRSIVCGKNTRSNRSIDPLDLSDYKYAEIYKTEVSFDKNTSALFNNINSDQVVNVIATGKLLTIKKGFYTLQELMSAINNTGVLISLITTEENAYHCKLTSSVDFSNAHELQEILGFDNVVASGISNHPVDITRGLNVLQIYSSIVNSDTDTPICTIKIDDPTKDFHDCLYTNCPIITTPINYIDIVFRNIHGEVVELNAENINVTLFIRAYNEMELIGDQPLVERAFNITTGIDKLEGGKFTKQLDNSMCLTDGKVVNANFLLDGKINNLSSDQTIELDGVCYTIPAGCYELQELLARLNALSSAVFSYVSSGEDSYKLTISGCEKISCSDELANMLGLEGISKGEEVETIRYQLTESANVFIYKNNNASYYIPVATGIYTEKVFFKKVEDAIRPYQSNISITDCGNYWQLNKGEIFPADGTYASRSINKYYWSSAINHRKEGDNSIIPKVGYFYFDENVTFTHCLEYFEISNYGDRKEFIVTANFTDKNNTPIDSLTFDLANYIGRNNTHQFLKDFETFVGTYLKFVFNRGHVYVVTYDSNCRVAFTGSPTFIRAFHLPTSPKQWFDMYIDNTYHKGELIDFTGYTLFIEVEGCPPLDVHFNRKCNLRTYFSNIRMTTREFFVGTYNIGVSFLLYITPFGVAFSPTNGFKNTGLKYRFYGTVIDSGLLQGLHTSYDNCEDFVYTDFSNFKTHQLNLGYTNLEGFKTGLQQVYESKENSTAVLPSLEYNVSDYGELRVRVPNAMTGLILSENSVLKYLGKDVGGRHRAPLYDENWFYPPSANIEVTADNYQVIISKPSGEDQIINIPLGWYTKESLFEKLNSYLEHPFTRKETYWVLDYCPNKLDYNLGIDFLVMSSEVRVYYPNNKVIESFMLKGSYPVNITNGFNLVNVFTNIIETSANTDNYLTSFVIDRTTGKNVSAAGVKYNYANSSKPINRVIAESNINSIDYYFSREDGQPFNINGKINCTLEIVE